MRSRPMLALALGCVLVGACSGSTHPAARVASTASSAVRTTTSTSTTTSTTAPAPNATEPTTTSTPPTTAPPTTYNTGPFDAGGSPTGTDAPPAPTDTPGTTTTTLPHRDPHPTGQGTASCTGPTSGPYTVNARQPWTDGVDETGSGTFTDYGQHSMPGNRGDTLYAYVGPPEVGTGEPAHCVYAGWSGPP